MREQRAVHHRQADHDGDAVALDGFEHCGRVEAAKDDERAADRERRHQHCVLAAMKERQHAAPHVAALGAAAPFDHVAQQHRVHRGVRMHHAFLPPGGAARVHDERKLRAVDVHFGQRGGALSDRFRHGGNPLGRRIAVEHAEHRRDALVLQQIAQRGLGVQGRVDHDVADLCMREDVADGIDRERGVDRHPHHSGLLDAEHRDHHLDRVVAQHAHALPARKAQAQQVVREAVRGGVELAVAHAVRPVDQRGARAEAPRGTVEHVAQRNARDACNRGGWLGCGADCGHGFVSPVFGRSLIDLAARGYGPPGGASCEEWLHEERPAEAGRLPIQDPARPRVRSAPSGMPRALAAAP
jgi:hypothetical protein